MIRFKKRHTCNSTGEGAVEQSCVMRGKWSSLKKSMLGPGNQVSHVSVHRWTKENITVFSLSDSEIRGCILRSMPEGTDTRSWFKSYLFKGSFSPYVCVIWGVGEIL